MYQRRIKILSNHVFSRPMSIIPSNNVIKHSYNQFVFQINPYSSTYISYKPNSNLIDLRFPSDYTYITNIRNNYNFKMVMYLKHKNIVEQIIIKPTTVIDLIKNKDAIITMHTCYSMDNLSISYDAYKLPSKL
jgi:hypothetical protein